MGGEFYDREFEVTLAQRDAMADALRAMVAIVTEVGGYMTHERQGQLRHARALLAEHEEARK